MLGNKWLAESDERDEAQRLTSPGMADWVDLAGKHHCASCFFFEHRRCGLFARIMRARGASKKYRGIELPPGQRACRRYDPRRERRDNSSLQHQEDNNMPKVSEMYPKRGLLTARELEGQPDLVVTINHVAYDQPVGGGRLGNVVHFVEDGRGLVLGQVIANQIAEALGKDDTDDWPGSRITLFYDDTVEFKDKDGKVVRGGVRVRRHTAQSNGQVAVLPPRRQQMDDEIPF